MIYSNSNYSNIAFWDKTFFMASETFWGLLLFELKLLHTHEFKQGQACL